MTILRDAVAAPVSLRAGSSATKVAATVDIQRSNLRTFALIIAALIVTLSGALMALNTMLVHGAFAVQAMQTQSQDLQRQQQALGDSVAFEESPEQLAQKAAALGMRPAVNPVFLKLGLSQSNALAHSAGGESTASTAVVMPH